MNVIISFGVMTSTKGAEQKCSIKSMIWFRIFEFFFMADIAACVYFVCTLNWMMIGIGVSIMLLQTLVKDRFQPIIDLLANKLEIPRFFKITRLYEEPIPAKEKTMFCIYPHSVYAYGVLMNLNYPDYPNDKFSNMIGLSSRFMLSLPILGLILRVWGLQSVDSTNLKRLLAQGKSVGIVPGGYEEATLTSTKEVRIFIKQRKGFIKYALRNGYTIRPTIITKEHQVFWTLEGGSTIRLLLNKLKIPGVVFFSRYGLFFPPNQKFDTIIGKGITGPRKKFQEQPTTEQIDTIHQRYIKELTELYERHQHKNNGVPLKVY